MTWREDHPGGVITCDSPGCTRTRRNYCQPTERDEWEAFQAPNMSHVLDLCPTHRARADEEPE